MDLTKKMCVACEGNEKPFSREKTRSYLLKLDNWDLLNNSNEIEKNFEFKNFKEALDFINKVGNLAESEGHHPNIFLHNYNKVKISLTTHAIRGLSENDFIMASKIEKL